MLLPSRHVIKPFLAASLFLHFNINAECKDEAYTLIDADFMLQANLPEQYNGTEEIRNVDFGIYSAEKGGVQLGTTTSLPLIKVLNNQFNQLIPFSIPSTGATDEWWLEIFSKDSPDLQPGRLRIPLDPESKKIRCHNKLNDSFSKICRSHNMKYITVLKSSYFERYSRKNNRLPKVEYSYDYGKTFKSVTVQGPAGMKYWDWIDVSASDSGLKIAAIVEGDGRRAVWLSQDQGKSWTQTSLSSEMNWKKVIISGDGKTIIALNHNTENEKLSPTYTVWKSTDGGSVWNAIEELGISNFDQVPTRRDDRNIITLKDGVLLYQSLDGGDTWKKISIPDKYMTCYDVSKDGSKHAMVVRKQVAIDGKEEALAGTGHIEYEDDKNSNKLINSTKAVSFVYLSDDGGKTWASKSPYEQLDQGVVNSALENGCNFPFIWNIVEFTYDEKELILSSQSSDVNMDMNCGLYGSLWKTSNWGESWDKIVIDTKSNDYITNNLMGVDFESAILNRPDGQSLIQFFVTNSYVKNIDNFKDSAKAYASSLLHSADNGRTWKSITPDFNNESINMTNYSYQPGLTTILDNNYVWSDDRNNSGMREFYGGSNFLIGRLLLTPYKFLKLKDNKLVPSKSMPHSSTEPFESIGEVGKLSTIVGLSSNWTVTTPTLINSQVNSPWIRIKANQGKTDILHKSFENYKTWTVDFTINKAAKISQQNGLKVGFSLPEGIAMPPHDTNITVYRSSNQFQAATFPEITGTKSIRLIRDENKLFVFERIDNQWKLTNYYKFDGKSNSTVKLFVEKLDSFSIDSEGHPTWNAEWYDYVEISGPEISLTTQYPDDFIAFSYFDGTKSASYNYPGSVVFNGYGRNSYKVGPGLPSPDYRVYGVLPEKRYRIKLVTNLPEQYHSDPGDFSVNIYGFDKNNKPGLLFQAPLKIDKGAFEHEIDVTLPPAVYYSRIKIERDPNRTSSSMPDVSPIIVERVRDTPNEGNSYRVKAFLNGHD